MEVLGSEFLNDIEKAFTLQQIDDAWVEHLQKISFLKDSIKWVAYGNKNPVTEYKKEGFDLFSNMMARIKEESTEYLFKVQVNNELEMEDEFVSKPQNVVEHRGNSNPLEKPVTIRRDEDKVGRNDPCPCGSGKKYKKCHGK